MRNISETDSQKDCRVLGILPARYASSRFPGKPLQPILGTPMILHTFQRAKESNSLDEVVVATDDERIEFVCKEASVPVVMTRPDWKSGTERCAEALDLMGGSEKWNIVVNIQGDEPALDPAVVDAVVDALKNSSEAVCSTASTRIDEAAAELPQRVKCVTDTNGHALYFSRSKIPYSSSGGKQAFQQHIGIYCYRSQFLKTFVTLEETPLQQSEDLEQLKIMENGYKIKVVEVDHDGAHGVDFEEDIASIEKYLKTRLGRSNQ